MYVLTATYTHHDDVGSAAGGNFLSYADEGKLMQVIRNLLTNAVRYNSFIKLSTACVCV